MRYLRNSHVFVLILVATSMTGTPVALAQTGTGPSDIRSFLAAELATAVSRVEDATAKLDVLERAIKNDRVDVDSLEEALGMGGDPDAVNRKLRELAARVDRTEQRLVQVAGDLDALHDTLQKIVTKAKIKKLRFIARKAAQAIGQVDSLQERVKFDQSEIVAINKDIQRLMEKTDTGG